MFKTVDSPTIGGCSPPSDKPMNASEWEEFQRSLADRPAYRWVGEMFRRHRGSSAAVSDD